MSLNKISREEMLERSRNDSVKGRNKDIVEIDYQGEKHKLSAKKVGTAIWVAIMLSVYALGLTGYNLYNGYNEMSITSEIVDDAIEEYRAIAQQGTKRTADKKGYYYEIGDIANDTLEKIANGGDFDIAIYGISCQIGYNSASMNSVIGDIGKKAAANPDKYPDVPVYSNMAEYQTERGWVDKDGKPTHKSYREGVRAYIEAKHTVDSVKGTSKK